MQSLSDSHHFHPKLETASRDQLLAHQWGAFQQLIKPVLKKNPFYQKKWGEAGVKHWREIKSWDDFNQLPFLTRMELSADQVGNPPYGTNLTFPFTQYTTWYRTSGTKGKPLFILGTRQDHALHARGWLYNFAGVGLRPGDVIFVAFSFGPFAGLWGTMPAADQMGIMAIPGGGLSTQQRIDFIMRHKPTVIICIPSYGLRMVEVAKELGIDLRMSNVHTLIHGGEPGASIPGYRMRLEQAWDANVYDSTGLTEMGHHGFECVHKSGVHMIESEYLLEILKPGTNHPVPEGEVGEMVMTALTKIGMPIIRYRTGDLARFTTRPCACGRTFGRIEGGILSRLDGMMTIRGVNVYPTTIEDCVMSVPGVVDYQVEVFEKQGMKELKIRIEVDHGEVDRTVAHLSEDLYRRLSLRSEIEVVPPGSLPRFEGKAKRFTYSDDQ